MGVIEWLQRKAGRRGVSRPLEMTWQFTAEGQIVMFSSNSPQLLEDAYFHNHVVWTVQDWKASKVASAPPLLYKVKNEKMYRKYRAQMKDVNYKNFWQIHDLKRKALEEVEDHAILDVLKNPNPLMSGYEFFYGHTVYKDIVGSSYMMAVRDGLDDPTQGQIRELWLPPAQNMTIISGGVANPVSKYKLTGAPDKDIDAKNVCHIRHFSPHHDAIQRLYGMSRVYPAQSIIKEYNSSVEYKTGINQSKGVRAVIFPKGVNDIGMVDITEAAAVQDKLNARLANSADGGIMASNVEIGVVNVGFTPEQLGTLKSNRETKKDICALYHVSDIIFGWSESATYNNMLEARKISLTDAVLPELEILKDALSGWLLPSFTKDKDYVIDFDDEWYAELQADKAEQVKWMNAAPLTPNERREVLGYERTEDLNGDKVIIGNNFQLLETLGTDSLPPADGEVVRDTFGTEE